MKIKHFGLETESKDWECESDNNNKKKMTNKEEDKYQCIENE